MVGDRRLISQGLNIGPLVDPDPAPAHVTCTMYGESKKDRKKRKDLLRDCKDDLAVRTRQSPLVFFLCRNLLEARHKFRA